MSNHQQSFKPRTISTTCVQNAVVMPPDNVKYAPSRGAAPYIEHVSDLNAFLRASSNMRVTSYDHDVIATPAMLELALYCLPAMRISSIFVVGSQQSFEALGISAFLSFRKQKVQVYFVTTAEEGLRMAKEPQRLLFLDGPCPDAAKAIGHQCLTRDGTEMADAFYDGKLYYHCHQWENYLDPKDPESVQFKGVAYPAWLPGRIFPLGGVLYLSKYGHGELGLWLAESTFKSVLADQYQSEEARSYAKCAYVASWGMWAFNSCCKSSETVDAAKEFPFVKKERTTAVEISPGIDEFFSRAIFQRGMFIHNFEAALLTDMSNASHVTSAGGLGALMFTLFGGVLKTLFIDATNSGRPSHHIGELFVYTLAAWVTGDVSILRAEAYVASRKARRHPSEGSAFPQGSVSLEGGAYSLSFGMEQYSEGLRNSSYERKYFYNIMEAYDPYEAVNGWSKAFAPSDDIYKALYAAVPAEKKKASGTFYARMVTGSRTEQAVHDVHLYQQKHSSWYIGLAFDSGITYAIAPAQFFSDFSGHQMVGVAGSTLKLKVVSADAVGSKSGKAKADTKKADPNNNNNTSPSPAPQGKAKKGSNKPENNGAQAGNANGKGTSYSDAVKTNNDQTPKASARPTQSKSSDWADEAETAEEQAQRDRQSRGRSRERPAANAAPQRSASAGRGQSTGGRSKSAEPGVTFSESAKNPGSNRGRKGNGNQRGGRGGRGGGQRGNQRGKPQSRN